VKSLEKTNYVGTIGRVEFYGRDNRYAHGMKYGRDYVSGVAIQWQKGRQVPIWPAHAAEAKPILPSFVKKVAMQ